MSICGSWWKDTKETLGQLAARLETGQDFSDQVTDSSCPCDGLARKEGLLCCIALKTFLVLQRTRNPQGKKNVEKSLGPDARVAKREKQHLKTGLRDLGRGFRTDLPQTIAKGVTS